MKRLEQDRYYSNARNRDWNNTDEHFSFDHDNNFDTSSKYNDYNSSYDNHGNVNGNRNPNLGVRSMENPNGYSANHGTDFSDVGLETRSHRMFVEYPRQNSHFGKGPKGYHRSDDRIKEDVCEALYAHPEIDASNLEVAVKEGIVTLSGNVENRFTKRQVEAAIEHLSGVEDVQNDMRVIKPSLKLLS